MELKTWLELEYGRVTKLAKAIGVPPSFVSNMANGVKPVPVDQCGPIEVFTERQVTCEELRPDKLTHFEYMRKRAAPDLDGMSVVLPGDAAGCCDIESLQKVA